MSDNIEKKEAEDTPPLPGAQIEKDGVGIAVTSNQSNERGLTTSTLTVDDSATVSGGALSDDEFEEESVSAGVPPEPEEPVVVAQSTTVPEVPAVNDVATEETAVADTAVPEQHIEYEVEPNKLTVPATHPIYVLLDKEKARSVALSVLPTTSEDLETFKTAIDSADQDDLPWVLSIRQASELSYPDNGLIRAAVRKGAHWKSQLNNTENSVPLGDHRIGYKVFDHPATKVSGSEAVEMFMAGTNLGRPVTIPLWHSGFWIKLRAPSAAYLAEIDRAIAFSREEMGMDLFGSVGSNDKLIFDEILVDAALRLVSETNVPISKNPMELKEYISYFDVDTLIWGMAQAAYPEGAQIVIPCPSCKGVSTVLANLTRMRFVDESRLTQKQIAMMSKGPKVKVTVDQLREYREEFGVLNNQTWEWQGRKFYYTIPTIEQYFGTGRDYVTSVGRALTETLREDLNDDNRRASATKSILAMEEACRYVHHIREIKIPQSNQKANAENYGVVSDSESVLQILRLLSGEYEATSAFILSVEEFINDAIAVIIGFPNVACPDCGKFYLSKSGAETIVVPFNVGVGFFTLAQHRISEAGSEPLANITTLGATALISRELGSALPG